MRTLFGFAVPLVALIMLSACDDSPSPGKVLTIVVPQDGTAIDLSEDTDPGQEGLNYEVLVIGENFDEGDVVTLSAGDTTAEESFYRNPITFRDFNLGSSAGEVTLTATLASNTSITSSVAVTIVDSCPDLQITAPQDGAQLGAEDDESPGDVGFQYTITASTDAGDGVTAELYIDGDLSVSTTVVGTVATFAGVTLAENAHDYAVHIEGYGETCEWPSISITVDTGAPTCDLVAPEESILNVELDQDPDTIGMQTTFEVETENVGTITVTLVIDDSLLDPPVDTDDGTAEFPNTSLNEGERRVHALCADSGGNQGMSASRMYTVDTVPPDLRIVTPDDGAFISEEDNALPDIEGTQFVVRVTSDADDVEGERVEAALEGTDPPDYGVGVMLGGAAELHVNAGLHGDVALEATLWDEHGNVSVETININIDIDIPNVVIIDPVDDEVLNTGNDEDHIAPGLQYTVVACASENGEADLLSESSLISEGVVTEEPCDTDLPYRITFAGVTIPEGTQTLSVAFTDVAGNPFNSPGVSVTVDTVPPYCTHVTPVCPSIVSVLDLPIDITIRIDAETTCSITNESGSVIFEETVMPGIGGYYLFEDVTLDNGVNTMTCDAEDEHGNVMESTFCELSVDNVYTFTITEPENEAVLGSGDDQGSGSPFEARLCVSSTNVPDGEEFVADVDGTEVARATFAGPSTCFNVPLDEGVTILRVSVDVGGDGSSDAAQTITVTVDTTSPPPITNLTVDILDRRESSLRLSWDAPASEDAASHQVVWSHDPITTEEEFDSAHTVSWTGGLTPAGDPVVLDIHTLVIERDYYVAVRAQDAAGNTSDLESSSSPARPAFETTFTEEGAAGTSFGFPLGVAGDLDGDGVDDLVVTSVSGAFIFFGPLPEETTWAPSTTISVPGGWGTIVGVGDFNGDGQDDVAVGAPFDFDGALYVYYGGPSTAWTPMMSEGAADVALIGVTTDARLGWDVKPAGDFCGDGAGGDGFMDIAVSAPYADGIGSEARGHAYVVCGGDITSGAVANIDDGTLTVLRIDGPSTSTVTPSFGVTMAGLGDINGDGLDDVGIGHFRQGAGEAYVVRGMSFDTIVSESPISTTNATRVQTLVGEADGDFFGIGIAGAGDLDQDGFADLLVGANLSSEYGPASGKVYAFLSTGGWLDTTPAVIHTDWGRDGGDWFGYSVAHGGAGLGGASDRNIGHQGGGGNAPDIIAISRVSGNSEEPFSGRVVVLFGGAGVINVGDEIPTSRISDDPDTTESTDGLGFIRYEDPDSMLNSYVAYVGDVNNDGYEDFAVGDVEHNTYAGRVLVYY